MYRYESKWQKERVCFSGQQFFSELVSDIEASTTSLSLEYYIFEDDAVGRLVVDALKRASRRGVSIRVIVDGVGSPQFGWYLLPELLEAGVLSKIYHPLPWDLSLRQFTGTPALFVRFFRRLWSINRRNHRKVCIIDGKIAWIGSLNITASHLGKEQTPAWRDTSVRVEGEAVSLLTEAFEQTWHNNIDKFMLPKKLWKNWRVRHRLPVRVNSHWRLRRWCYKDLLHKLKRAKDRVWITSAYFIPTSQLLKAIGDCASRGVEVKIILPSISDVPFIRMISESLYENLLKRRVQIFEYLPTILHTKSIAIDKWNVLGSSNLNHRSLLHDLELDVIVSQVPTIEALEKQFQKDVNESREVTIETLRQRSLGTRILGKVLLALRHWL